MPQSHAFVVEQLIAAGAIPIGKTNLDQFATGLNGTRSPYGIPTCVFDERYISGGSSSGSAVAVGSGFVPFSLGTDTAGSGRVPAAFNNLVGIKPTKGTISTRGLVPAARSLDCISIFAHSVDDALTVARIASAYDAADSFSRQVQSSTWTERKWPARFTFECRPHHNSSFLMTCKLRLFEEAIRKLEKMGGNVYVSTILHSRKRLNCSIAALGWPSGLRPSKVLLTNTLVRSTR
jgi:allophanate hydrolase